MRSPTCRVGSAGEPESPRLHRRTEARLGRHRSRTDPSTEPRSRPGSIGTNGSPAPGNGVMADGLPVHEVRPARKLLEDAGAELTFLPPNGHDPSKWSSLDANVVSKGRRTRRGGIVAEGRDSPRQACPRTSARDTSVMPAVHQPKMNTL